MWFIGQTTASIILEKKNNPAYVHEAKTCLLLMWQQYIILHGYISQIIQIGNMRLPKISGTDPTAAVEGAASKGSIADAGLDPASSPITVRGASLTGRKAVRLQSHKVDGTVMCCPDEPQKNMWCRFMLVPAIPLEQIPPLPPVVASEGFVNTDCSEPDGLKPSTDPETAFLLLSSLNTDIPQGLSKLG